MSNETLTNRVAKSGIITIDLEKYLPESNVLEEIDMKQFLVQEMVLMEKKFREFISAFDFSRFQQKHVALYCSKDALIPHWAYMLVASKLVEHNASGIQFCDPETLQKRLLIQNILQINSKDFVERRVVIKGCSKTGIDAEAYMTVTQKLQPVVKSLMYGEPCSTVPVFKRKN